MYVINVRCIYLLIKAIILIDLNIFYYIDLFCMWGREHSVCMILKRHPVGVSPLLPPCGIWGVELRSSVLTKSAFTC